MTTAYTFVQLAAGDPAETLSTIRQTPGVKLARALKGPADIVAVVEAPDLEALWDTLMAIRAVDGIRPPIHVSYDLLEHEALWARSGSARYVRVSFHTAALSSSDRGDRPWLAEEILSAGHAVGQDRSG